MPLSTAWAISLASWFDCSIGHEEGRVLPTYHQLQHTFHLLQTLPMSRCEQCMHLLCACDMWRFTQYLVKNAFGRRPTACFRIEIHLRSDFGMTLTSKWPWCQTIRIINFTKVTLVLKHDGEAYFGIRYTDLDVKIFLDMIFCTNTELRNSTENTYLCNQHYSNILH